MRLRERPLSARRRPRDHRAACARSSRRSRPTRHSRRTNHRRDVRSANRPAPGSIAVVDPEDGDRLVGVGVIDIGVRRTSGGPYLFGAVHPDHWHRGIGTRIVQLSGDQATVWRDADRPGPARRVEDVGARPAVRHRGAGRCPGFATWRWFLRMRRDLGQPARRRAEVAGYAIRGYTDADCRGDPAGLQRPSPTTGGRALGPAALAATWSAPRFRPEHSFLATRRHRCDRLASCWSTSSTSRPRMFGFRTGYIALVGSERPRPRSWHRLGPGHPVHASMAADGYRTSELTSTSQSPTGGRSDLRAGRLHHPRAQHRHRPAVLGPERACPPGPTCSRTGEPAAGR